ncbi:MAG TPA: cytochrome c oxidase subunit II [Thermomicrobiales bacterium]|nr:cytochrome c oxidase subunit II [Thermomicrobiales bacterium]
MTTTGRGVVLGGALAITVVLLAGCQPEDSPSALDPRGPRAERIADLWWLMFWLGTAVFVVVMGFLAYATFRAWRRGVADGEPTDRHANPFLAGAMAVTVLVILVVLGFSLWTSRLLVEPDEPPALTVDVIGNQWWWEVRYPEVDAITANEIHIPVGEPVRVRLLSDDVIHSFWIPELSGKLDLLPGITNEFWIEADEPGTYLGECAEFCGIQHAHMAFLVVAEPRERFDLWLTGQVEPASFVADPLVERGQDIFLTAGCAACHTVRGTAADGEIGPDLTHLASRETIAAGMLENNLGNLMGWIADPQAIKPGNHMPNLPLAPEELEAVVAYLLSLE